jgi:hypothetical protein
MVCFVMKLERLWAIMIDFRLCETDQLTRSIDDAERAKMKSLVHNIGFAPDVDPISKRKRKLLKLPPNVALEKRNERKKIALDNLISEADKLSTLSKSSCKYDFLRSL